MLHKVIASLALGQFPLSTGNGKFFDMLQAIAEDPMPTLSPNSFSAELCDFVELTLRRDAAERPTAAQLLKHPFLLAHQDCDRLVNMVKVARATPAEVRTQTYVFARVQRTFPPPRPAPPTLARVFHSYSLLVKICFNTTSIGVF